MPYVIFPQMPQTVGAGRTVYNGCIDTITGEYACEVDDVREGEREIDYAKHATIKSAAEKAYEESPPIPPPIHVPTPIEQITTALLADPNIAKETKAAIARIGIVSEPVPVAIAEVGSA